MGCDAASAGNVNVCFDDLLLREDLLTHPPTTMCASNSTVAKPESGTLRASRRLGPATKLFWTTSLPGTTSKHLGSCTSTVPAHVATTCSVCCHQPPPSSTPKTTTSPSYRASPPFLTLPTDHNCGSAHLPAPPPRRPWTRLCHHIVPARAPTSNNTPPATPSRHARHPIHPTPQPSHGPTPTPRLRTLLGRPCSRQRASNTTGPRTTAPRTRMATPGSITPSRVHRTSSKPPPSQPGHAPIAVRPICQQNFHYHPF